MWPTTTTPATVDSGDTASVELGMKFTANANGFITGIQFYKATTNTGTHTGSLWSSTGQLLATGTFTSETASGWQTLVFSTPVAITAGTTYVASYHTTVGHYSVSRSYFASSYSSGAFTVPANGGVFIYGNMPSPRRATSRAITGSNQPSHRWAAKGVHWPRRDRKRQRRYSLGSNRRRKGRSIGEQRDAWGRVSLPFFRPDLKDTAQHWQD